MPVIICYINMFSHIQRIEVLPSGESIAVSLDDLPLTVVNLCDKYATSEIHIFGQDGYLD
jgi:hypothetical protein